MPSNQQPNKNSSPELPGDNETKPFNVEAQGAAFGMKKYNYSGTDAGAANVNTAVSGGADAGIRGHK